MKEQIYRLLLSQLVFQLAKFHLEELEKGLDSMIGPKGVKLSGGQMQRTAATRMFVREPELLVFDDLSSALDVETAFGEVSARGVVKAGG